MSAETIANSLLVIVTGIYVFLTYQILHANRETMHEMRKQNESFLRPYIVANPFVVPGSVIFYLRIKNTGKSAASNMKIDIDRDFYQFGGGTTGKQDNLKDFSCFSNTIDCFAPEAEIVFELAQTFVVFGEKSDPTKTPSNFTLTISYNWGAISYKELTVIDLRPYLNSRTPPDSIYTEMKGIREKISAINDNLKRIS